MIEFFTFFCKEIITTAYELASNEYQRNRAMIVLLRFYFSHLCTCRSITVDPLELDSFVFEVLFYLNTIRTPLCTYDPIAHLGNIQYYREKEIFVWLQSENKIYLDDEFRSVGRVHLLVLMETKECRFCFRRSSLRSSLAVWVWLFWLSIIFLPFLMLLMRLYSRDYR